MSEENQAVENVPTTPVVPEVIETVPNDPVENETVNPNEPEDTKPQKTFTQEELDKILNKRLAIERRRFEREQGSAKPNQEVSRTNDFPTIDQFDTPEDYAEALANQKLAERENQERLSKVLKSYNEREELALDKYDDFEQVAYNPKLRITEVMAQTIRESEMGPDLAYHLGMNPKEAERISQLSPNSQAKELGKIEAKLALEPVVKKVSNAPTPVNPLSSRSSGNPSFDTTDPRSVSTMSTSEWIAAENRRLMKKAQAQRN